MNTEQPMDNRVGGRKLPGWVFELIQIGMAIIFSIFSVLFLLQFGA